MLGLLVNTFITAPVVSLSFFLPYHQANNILQNELTSPIEVKANFVRVLYNSNGDEIHLQEVFWP